MEKRSIHCDYKGTLNGHNGKLIFIFLKAANEHGHDTKTFSSYGCLIDHDIMNMFDNKAGFLLPTIEKSAIPDMNENSPQYDIIIDDKPVVRPDADYFKMHANIWINPNSQTLEQDLINLAKNELGFDFKPPKP